MKACELLLKTVKIACHNLGQCIDVSIKQVQLTKHAPKKKLIMCKAFKFIGDDEDDSKCETKEAHFNEAHKAVSETVESLKYYFHSQVLLLFLQYTTTFHNQWA